MPINTNGDFVWDDESFESVKDSLEGPFYTLPDGLTREEIHQWLEDCAEGKIEPDTTD